MGPHPRGLLTRSSRTGCFTEFWCLAPAASKHKPDFGLGTLNATGAEGAIGSWEGAVSYERGSELGVELTGLWCSAAAASKRKPDFGLGTLNANDEIE